MAVLLILTNPTENQSITIQTGLGSTHLWRIRLCVWIEIYIFVFAPVFGMIFYKCSVCVFVCVNMFVDCGWPCTQVFLCPMSMGLSVGVCLYVSVFVCLRQCVFLCGSEQGGRHGGQQDGRHGGR